MSERIKLQPLSTSASSLQDSLSTSSPNSQTNNAGRKSRSASEAERYRKHRLSDAIEPDEIPLFDDGELPLHRKQPKRRSCLFMMKALTCAPCLVLKWLAQSLALPFGIGQTRKKEPRTIILPIDPNRFKYARNAIRNQKYNFITFIPLVLYEQFKFFFNLYFLLVSLSQFIPSLKIGYLFTYFAPLCFVLIVTMGKEAWDDYKRYKRDQEANSQLYQVFDPLNRRLMNVASSNIKVGDLVLIQKNQRIPADMILLRTTETNGACFIRTDQLDGETDWKLRLAVPSCQKLPNDQGLFTLKSEIYAEAPHKDIHTFIGNFTQNNSPTEPLGVENTLWTNTVLASGTAIGCVIYTGTDTRAVMNTNHPGTKVGLLDLELNRLSKVLFVVTLALSFLMIALNGFQGLWYIYLSRFLILFSSIIPISLRVNLDMGKTVYSMLIMQDKEIPNTVVRTSTIPEELGRVEYLLSDKTGTLTKNEMELKKLHLGTMSYTVETFDEIRSHLETTLSLSARTANTDTSYKYGRASGLNVAGGKGRRDIASRVKDIAQALGLCHNVTPVYSQIDQNLSYQASSPDEIAIVNWTQHVGLTLVHRDISTIHLQTPTKETLEFEILQIFPFTSETKRMGIIVRDRLNGEITFYMKGADVVMTKIVQYNDWLEEECGNMAREGLRTLVVARKKLSDEVYADFLDRYSQAKVSVHDRNAAVQEVISNILENELELLGLTGVEDKLQDDVKPTLEALRNAGIRVWMLTGDKVETATCIAVSSRLVSRNQQIHTITKLKSPIDAQDELDILSTKTDACLIIDGESLQVCLDHLRKQFITTTVQLPAVVCCRCSPTQKAEVTKLIKDFTQKRVCAIGDGGNDVSMIQSANVGVGIVGKEGKQASLAADFSITQFSHLTRLLLWHGRNSYQRSAKLSQFVIHRGLIISVMQAVFSAIFYFAPIALYQGMLLVGYSTIYTMAPVFSLVLDRDVTAELALLYPELYKDLIKGRLLSFKTFFLWLVISIYQGGVIMMLALWLFENEFIHIISISFTALIFNELLMVAIEITTWHRYMIISEIITVIIYVLSMMILKEFDLQFIMTWKFVWKSAVITLISAFPLYLVKKISHVYAPPSYKKLVHH